MQQQAVSSIARQFNEQHKARLARISSRAYVPPGQRKPFRVEIVEIEPEETIIEVVACSGHVVIVTEREAVDASVSFEPVAPGISIDDVQRAVCHHYSFSRANLISHRRSASFIRPRLVGYYLSKVLTLRSLPEIGRRFGDRDHTSILSGVRKIERLRREGADIEHELQAIASSLGGSLPAPAP
jgi:hypothetical protein